MDKKKMHIGLIGPKGSGKDEFVKTLKKIAIDKTIVSFRSSDIIGSILDILHQPHTLQNLQDIPEALWTKFPKNIISEAVKYTILEYPTYPESDIIIFNGVRTEEDVTMLKKFEDNIIVYITAPLDVRHDRLKKRKEKIGEAYMTRDEFLESENKKSDQLIPIIGPKANWIIENIGDLAMFEQQVSYFYKTMRY